MRCSPIVGQVWRQFKLQPGPADLVSQFIRYAAKTVGWRAGRKPGPETDSRSPEPKVTGSNPVGRANLFNKLASNRQRHQVAIIVPGERSGEQFAAVPGKGAALCDSDNEKLDVPRPNVRFKG